jgi:hypothetical protein
MLLGILQAPWAGAEGLPSGTPCHCADTAVPCGAHKPVEKTRLRALRLQDAVRNGDLTADEARRLADNPAEEFPHTLEPHASHTDRPDIPGKPERRFWREQRRRALHPAPLPLE